MRSERQRSTAVSRLPSQNSHVLLVGLDDFPVRLAEAYDTTLAAFTRLIGQTATPNPAPRPALSPELFVTGQRAIARRVEFQARVRFASLVCRGDLHVDEFAAAGAGASDFGRSAHAIHASSSLPWRFAGNFQLRLAPRALEFERALLPLVPWRPVWGRHLFGATRSARR